MILNEFCYNKGANIKTNILNEKFQLKIKLSENVGGKNIFLK